MNSNSNERRLIQNLKKKNEKLTFQNEELTKALTQEVELREGLEIELRMSKNKYRKLKDKISLLIGSKISSPCTLSSLSPEEDEKENLSEEEKENLNCNETSLLKVNSIKNHENDISLALFTDNIAELNNSELLDSYEIEFNSIAHCSKRGKSSSDYELSKLSNNDRSTRAILQRQFSFDFEKWDSDVVFILLR